MTDALGAFAATASTVPSAVTNSETVACAHCGVPSSPVPSGQKAFCCQGCAGAYSLIHGWGLADYYSLRERLSNQPPRAVAETATTADLLSDLEAAGVPVVDVGQGLSSVTLAIDGLHCGACAWLIERCPQLVDGWHAARVQMSDHTVRLVYDGKKTQPSRLAKVLGRLGYQIAPLPADGDAAGERYRQQDRRHLIHIAVAGFCAANAMWIAIALYAGEYSGIAAEHELALRWAGAILGGFAACVPGSVFFRGAWAALKTRTPHMDLPLALGIGAGALGSLVGAWRGVGDVYFDSIAVLVFLLLVGRWIQFRQQRRAGQAVNLLMRLTPMVARRVQADGTIQSVPAERLQIDDRIEVRAGEAIPADGIVETGESLLNRALLTGESAPVEVKPPDEVAAGTINMLRPLTVRVAAVGKQSRIGRLMQVVEEAASRQTPIVQMADRASGRFIRWILFLSCVTMIAWWSRGAGVALSHTVALLIVACPCALALATPLSIAVALGRSAHRKILIRSGDVFERMARPGTIWFDKTGTLTTGKMQVTHWSGDAEGLSAAAAIEQGSTHPIALAIVEHARRSGIARGTASAIEQSTGGGISGSVGGKQYHLGSPSYVAKQGVPSTESLNQQLQALARASCTPVVLATDAAVVGVFGVADALRPDVPETLDRLRSMGWKIGILSGDHPALVERIAEQLHISAAMAMGSLMPEQKVQRIESSRGSGTIVMVGDGVNDAAALAAADVGIATRGGAEVSLRAAPVFLGEEGLQGLALLSHAAQTTLRTIRRGFSVSLTYNMIAVSLAMLGIINPLLAAILMPISSLTVVSLALASRTYPPEQNPVTATMPAKPLLMTGGASA